MSTLYNIGFQWNWSILDQYVLIFQFVKINGNIPNYNDVECRVRFTHHIFVLYLWLKTPKLASSTQINLVKLKWR